MVKFTFNASISATCWLCNSVFSFFIILSIMSWSVLDPVGFSFFAFFLPSHVFFHCRLHLVHPWLQFILHLLKLHSLFRPLLLNGLKERWWALLLLIPHLAQGSFFLVPHGPPLYRGPSCLTKAPDILLFDLVGSTFTVTTYIHNYLPGNYSLQIWISTSCLCVWGTTYRKKELLYTSSFPNT